MPPPVVHIRSETEVPQGWRYLLEVEREDGSVTEHRLRLAWVDHNHWTGERPFPPSRVAQALVECVLAADPGVDLPDRFDAAIARRWVQGIDQRLAEHL